MNTEIQNQVKKDIEKREKEYSEAVKQQREWGSELKDYETYKYKRKKQFFTDLTFIFLHCGFYFALGMLWVLVAIFFK